MTRPIGMATPTVEELEAEIERLRAALEQIAYYFPDDCHKFQTTEAVNMKEIAREALAGNE